MRLLRFLVKRGHCSLTALLRVWTQQKTGISTVFGLPRQTAGCAICDPDKQSEFPEKKPSPDSGKNMQNEI